MLNGAKLMQFSLGLQISALRSLFGLKLTKAHSPVQRLYGRPEFAIAQTRDSEDAGLIAGVCSFSVLQILRVRAFSKIAESSVRCVAVYMIDLFWPTTIHVKHSQSVRVIQFCLNPDLHVSIARLVTGDFTEVLPRKHSGFCIVVQQRLEQFLGQFQCSLRWLLMGSRRNRVSDLDHLRPCLGTDRVHCTMQMGF